MNNPLYNQSSCLICPAGFFSEEGSPECTICPLNTYAENEQSSSCNKCASGEVNGFTGSFSKGDCLNTTINFVFGSLAFFAAVFAIVVYMWKGRLHRIAFQRNFRLIRKCIMMFGMMLTTADMISRACDRLRYYDDGAGRRNKRGWYKDCIEKCYRPFVEHVFKPYILLPIVCAVVIPAVTAMLVFQYSVQIIFNAMILWRAYKRLVSINFTVDFLDPFLNTIGDMFDVRLAVYVASYPIVYVIDHIYIFNINLNAVKVVCVGAQSPLFLLMDMIIVAVVIVIIESDVHVFWTMMVAPSLSKIRSMLFSRQYFVSHFLSTIFYLAILLMVSQVPDPSKLVQYCMGLVVIQRFFSDGSGYGGWVSASANCDNAVKISNGFAIPFDTILANFSAIFAVIACPAGMHLLGLFVFCITKYFLY
jgi:hypothetical protein